MGLKKILKGLFSVFDGKSARNEILLKKRLEVINNANRINFAVVLRTVSEAIIAGNYKLVCKILEPIVLGLENSESYKKELKSNFYDFSKNFEAILYLETQKNKEETKIMNTNAPYSLLYYFYGAALSNCAKLEDAKKSFKTALRWNPVSADILAEYAMNCYRDFDYEEFFKVTLESFKYAYIPEQLSICYKYMGLYYRRVKKYEAAKCCFLLSLKYKNDKQAKHLLDLNNESLKELDKELYDLNDEEIEVYGEKFGFPTKPSNLVIKTCFFWGEKFLVKGNKKLARYFYGKVYNVTKSTYLKTLLESLQDN